MPAHIGESREILVEGGHPGTVQHRLRRQIGIAEIHVRRLHPGQRRQHQRLGNIAIGLSPPMADLAIEETRLATVAPP